jgi:tetratricopeptide (TPR) repeat protein
VRERDPIEQRFLEMLAFAGTPMPCEAVARAADLDAGECLTRLGGLRAAQLVRVTRRGEERLVEPYHDRIRESVVGHLAAEGGARAAERHLRLGRALQETSDGGTLPQRVFAILQHLSAARALITTRREQLEVASLHLVATRAARLATAYSRAREHAVLGLSLAGAQGWTDAYPLTRGLWIERMEAEYLGGEADAAYESFEAARTRLTSPADRAALYAAWITLQSVHLRFAEALSAGREFLRVLGSPLPSRVSMAHVLREYAADRIARGRRPIDALLELEPMRDAAQESAMNIMMALGPAAYVLDTNLFTWMMLRIAGASMRHGVCRVSSYGFAGYGLVLSAAFGKHTEGASFGRVALALNDRFKDQSLAGKLHFIEASYLAPWTRPIAEAHEALRRAYDKSIRSGDRAYEIYSVLHLSMMEFFEATNLETLQATAERGQEISVRRREADVIDDSNRVIARYAAELRSPTAPELVASITDNSVLGRFFYHYCRAEIAYLRGRADRAAELLHAAVDSGRRAIFGTLMTVELACLEALVAARQFDASSGASAPRLMLSVASRVRKLASLARSQPVNFAAHHLLARAEMMRLMRRANEAEEIIQRAVQAAQEQGSPKREAIALTLAADYARRKGHEARAHSLRRAAHEAYARWGAGTLGADEGGNAATDRDPANLL